MQQISAHLKQWSTMHPHLLHLFLPLSEWLESLVWPNYDTELQSSDSSLDESVDAFINALLIDVQSILKISAPQQQVEEDTVEEDMDEEIKSKDNFIKDGLRQVESVTRSLHVDAVLKRLDTMLVKFTTSPADGVKDAVSRFLPFLDRYAALVDEQLLNHGLWTGAIFKLDYVLCSIIQTLAKDGFCTPPDTEADGEGEGATETSDGVGLGEGSGKENVSKEIEDESQVEGLQDEGAENDERNKDEGDDNAIEMSEDFGGYLEDVDEKDDEEGGEQSDGESEVDPEEQIGNLENDDPAAVDEKLWGDEAGPQDDKSSDDKTNQDHSKQDDQPSETVAKEENTQKNADKGDEKAGEKGDEKEQAEEQAEEGEQEMPEEDQETEDPNASGAPMDEHIKEADTLDLPEDLNLGEDSEMQGPEDLDPEDDEIPDAGSEGEEDSRDELDGDGDDEAPDANKADEDTEMDVDDDQMRKGQEDDKEDEQPAEENQEDKLPAMQPDLHSGDGKGDGLPEAGASGTVTEPEQGDAGVQGQGEESGEQDKQNEPPAES